jgi:alkylhydroperoxidase domain protein/CMD domain protein
MTHAQGSYTALFDPAEPGGLSPVERFALAVRVATHHAALEASGHYRQRLAAAGAGAEIVEAAAGADERAVLALPPRLQAMLRHAELLSTHPADATADDLQALADVGLSTAEIVVLSQIVAFVSFQVRVVTALQFIGGLTPGGAGAARSAGASPVAANSPAADAASGSTPATIVRPGPLRTPTAFTVAQIRFEPWLVPLDPADATPKQAEALKDRTGNSPYFRLLALDPDVLAERTATDKGIFYTHGGAPRAERELAAAATSRLNGCIYCASVHARLSAQLSKRNDDIDRLLDKGIDDIPALGLGDRWQAIVELAVALARTPSAATAAQIDRLRAIGLSELEILDVAQAAAFFSWANRLMLTLGEPYIPDESAT